MIVCRALIISADITIGSTPNHGVPPCVCLPLIFIVNLEEDAKNPLGL